jgi:uncharacterized repeat protein (TIGR03803 family)
LAALFFTTRASAIELAAQPVYSFTNGSPKSPLLLASNGLFYGTTQYGGSNGWGNIFSMTESGAVADLYDLKYTDGIYPTAQLAQGPNGKLYGVTAAGSSNNYGSVFMVSTNGAFTPLYAFMGQNDGGSPYGSLTLATNGKLYGTTYSGGSNNVGAIFTINAAGAFASLYSFSNGVDGSNPQAGLTLASNGDLYGAARSRASGYGTLFRITPAGMLTALYTFTNGIDGSGPVAPLTVGPGGNLYGSAVSGGAGYGVFFKLSLSGSFTPLYALIDTDGYDPVNALTLGSDGNFYGALDEGGADGYGDIFRLAPNGDFTPVAVASSTLGEVPSAVTEGADGNFFGVASAGGASGAGTAFEFSTSIPAPGLGVLLPAPEFNALVDLYNNDDGKKWDNSAGWPDGSVSLWYGVTTGAASYDANWNVTAPVHVTALTLSSESLQGTIPDALTNLTFLQSLDLSFNSLSGAVPMGLGNLRQLQQLDLSYNALTLFPNGATNLPQLTTLTLNNNDFAGPLPPGLGKLTNLTSLNLAQNQFSGPLPNGITNLTALIYLYLNNNSFSGGLPSGIGNLTNAQEVSLDYNAFTGTIPDSLTNLAAYNISLDFNDFTGSIPFGIGNLRVTTLDLSYNLLSGSIPASITNLVTIYTLNLNDNDLTGGIPSGMDNMSQLQALYLDDNQLSGPIPDDLTNRSLSTLELDDNFLTGPIPTGLTNLFLETLDLSHNFLSGSIPEGLGMNGGYSVVLSFNDLTGPMPSSLTNLYQFGQLWVDNNFLTGPIPSPLPFTLYLENNDFDVTLGSADYDSLTNLAATHVGGFFPQNSQLDYDASQLLQNGGFETGTFTNWSVVGNSSQYVSVSSNPQDVHSGLYGALLGSVGGPAYLYQKIPTLPGIEYQVSLWLNSPDNVGFNEFTASWNGDTFIDKTNFGAAGWANLQFQAIAATSNSVLQLGFRNDQSFFGLDDVTVTVAPPIIQAAPPVGHTVQLTWNTAPPWSYRLDSSTNLVTWTLGSVVVATGPAMTASPTLAPGGHTFYRVVMIPPP